MCYWLKLEDGTVVHVNTSHKPKYCACGRQADLLCDWKMPAKKSGTCDGPICRKCALEVAPDRHLCKFHQKAYEQWKRRHRDKVVKVSAGQSVVEVKAEQLRLGL